MSDHHLPAEMLDHVVDHLHDTEDALRNCCLVSKSWIPRARKHLFADVYLPTAESLQSWEETFPDPSTSPACYASTLSVGCPHVVTTADAEIGGWIRCFSRVVYLDVDIDGLFADAGSVSLVPFHGFSPIIKSLRVTAAVLSSWRVLGLILSFPLLEDLAMMAHYEAPADTDDGPGEDETPAGAQPSSPPMLTGSLELFLGIGTKQFTHRLLSLAGGIHFRKLTLTWCHEEDLPLIMGLVKECSRTLESLDITGNLLGTCILDLCSHRQLTSVSSWVAANFNRPLESDKTQRCDVSAQFLDYRMGHRSAPNRIQTPRSPAYLGLCASRTDLRR